MSENKDIPRILYPIRLGQKFSQDYQDILIQYPLNVRIALTEHIIKVFEIMQEHLFSDPKLAQKKYA